MIDWLPENNRIERILLMSKFDFVTRYYGSFLGLFWALLKPLFELAVFFVVFTCLLKNRTEKFQLFLFIGIIIFQFFTESVRGSLNIFRSKRFLFENIQISKLDIYYSAIGTTFLGFLFNFAIFSIGNIFLNDTLSWYISIFPILVLNLLVLILAAQLIFSTISIYMRDIENVWFVINTLLFWSSGIFFDLAGLKGKAALIQYLNPLAGILINSRKILIHDQPPDMALLVANFLLAFTLLLAGLWIFNKYCDKALEKI